jgi:hypothetical protein
VIGEIALLIGTTALVKFVQEDLILAGVALILIV